MEGGGGEKRALPTWAWAIAGVVALCAGAYGGAWIAPIANGFIDLYAAVFQVFGRLLQ